MRPCPNLSCTTGVPSLVGFKGHRCYVSCNACGMHGPESNNPEKAVAAWDELPRATKLARRELLDQKLYEAYSSGEISYESLAEIHNMTTSRVYSSIQRHRKLLKEGY